MLGGPFYSLDLLLALSTQWVAWVTDPDVKTQPGKATHRLGGMPGFQLPAMYTTEGSTT